MDVLSSKVTSVPALFYALKCFEYYGHLFCPANTITFTLLTDLRVGLWEEKEKAKKVVFQNILCRMIRLSFLSYFLLSHPYNNETFGIPCVYLKLIYSQKFKSLCGKSFMPALLDAVF